MKVKYIFLMFFVIVGFVACNDDNQPVLPQYEASVLTHPTDGTSYELLQKNKNNEAFSLNWTSFKQSELNLGAPTYYIQVDTVGDNFVNAKTVTQISEVEDATASTVYTASVTVGDLNSILTGNLNLTPGESYNLQARVVTVIGNAIIPASASNVFSFKAIPFESVDVPDPIHLIGSMFGINSWDNSNYKFVMFRATNDGINTYTGKFAASSEFKLIPNKDLNSWSFTYGSGGSGILSTSGGNITDITTAGYYTVTADIDNLTYSVTAYDASAATVYTDIEMIGDFNSWADAGTIKLTKTSYDPHIWAADNVTLTAGGIKFRANTSWSVNWGGDTFPYGGNSGGNIPVQDGTYFVKFNDLTGLYVFLSK